MAEMNTRKLPAGVQFFSIIRKEGYLYVDKTDLVWQLTHSGDLYNYLRKCTSFCLHHRHYKVYPNILILGAQPSDEYQFSSAVCPSLRHHRGRDGCLFRKSLADKMDCNIEEGHNYFSSTFLIYTIAVLLPLVVMPFEGSSENIRSSFVAVERGREVSLA